MGLIQSARGYLASQFQTNNRKRKRNLVFSDISANEESDELSDSMINYSSSKRLRSTTTSQYIYRVLFQEGKNSDVSLTILGKEWHLHKIYLCQSPYFTTMFSGSWKESKENVINIEIADSNINLNSLEVVLGSLYQDELFIEPAEVVSLLATATHFQLDDMISKCCEVMIQNVNIKTVINYYYASMTYGVKIVKEACIRWFLVNLLSYLPEKPMYLREISIDLMELLVVSKDLCVIQTEFSLYVLLKLWLYLKLHTTWEGSSQDGISMSQNFFREHGSNESNKDFLETDAGKSYAKVFGGLRFASLIGHPQDVDMILRDRIIPSCLFFPVFRMQWYRMLQTEQGYDNGPLRLCEPEFYKHSFRCGRQLNSSGHHMWRWTGFHFGVDLVMTYENEWLTLRRNHRIENDMALSQQTRRNIMYSVTVFSLDDLRSVKCARSTGVQSITLGRNEEVEILAIKKDEFPLQISAHFLFITPNSSI